MSDSKNPLDYLPAKEAEAMAAILTLIDSVISDEALADDLCGMVLVTIEEWGKANERHPKN